MLRFVILMKYSEIYDNLNSDCNNKSTAFHQRVVFNGDMHTKFIRIY